MPVDKNSNVYWLVSSYVVHIPTFVKLKFKEAYTLYVHPSSV